MTGGHGKLRLIGDRSFYMHVAAVAVPIIVQNTLTNIISLLDNIMVGQVGTIPMSAVAVVNQLILIFYLCVWGGLAGAGIFGAQFFGSGDMEGLRQTTRFKMVMMVVFTLAAWGIFLAFGDRLIGLYIAPGTSAEARAETLRLGLQYLRVMLIGLLPFAATQAYASAMRESGKTYLPMYASITAMFVNFVFNALLIFGLFGFPKLGVLGAAVATVLSRFAEIIIILVGGMRDTENYGYLRGLYRGFRISGDLARRIAVKAAPLLVNEFFWSTAEAAILQGYSMRGINVVAAMNIAGVVFLVFEEFSLSLGNATGILAGQCLGARKFDEARETSLRIMLVSVVFCIFTGLVLWAIAPMIPQIYRTEASVREMAVRCIRVMAFWLPMWALANIGYFTVRSGGRVAVVFLFDSVFTWAVKVSVLRILVMKTAMDVVDIYFTVNGLETIKAVVGILLVLSGMWMQDLVNDVKDLE